MHPLWLESKATDPKLTAREWALVCFLATAALLGLLIFYVVIGGASYCTQSDADGSRCPLGAEISPIVFGSIESPIIPR